ncbi:MAG: hypothetical protein GQ528_00825, partial [Woeseiaceae bacterium]|nr:hypothetical protein [Woeseiaceae bacterium]
ALNIDLTATILDMAGVSATAQLHGKSLLPIINGEHPDRTIVHECLGGYGGNDPFLAAMNGRWLYVQTLAKDNHKKITFEELYDKDRDPDEMKNLANSPEHAAILKALRAKIADHRTSILQER